MAQYSIYRNTNPRTRAHFPLLVDVQADLLADLKTRTVVPLANVAVHGIKPIDRLMPILDIDAEQYVMVTPQLAGIPAAMLGESVANVREHRDAIVAALDLLFTGA